MNRRKFLIFMLGSCLSSYGESNNGNPYAWVRLSRFGRTAWINLDTPEGYGAFRWFLQDSQTGSCGYPPPLLGYILSWMQGFLRNWGYDAPMVITSGMRLKTTNDRTEGAAQHSEHIPNAEGVFRAVDVMVPGISGEYLGRLASLAKQGGVGFYGADGHTHVDIGKIRYWRNLRKLHHNP